jgi:ABC-2 type transport system permease protein
MRHLRHIWFIMLKELKVFFRDRLALFFWILFPFMFIIIFNFVLSDVGGGDERLELHVTTQEPAGGISYLILAALKTGNESQLGFGDSVIIWDRDYEKARQAVEDGELGGLLTFPEDFSDSLFAEKGPELEVVADSEAVDTRTALNGFANSIATRFSSVRVAANATAELLISAGRIDRNDRDAIDGIRWDTLSRAGEEAQESFIQLEREWVGEVEPENAANFVVPGYLVMFVFFAAAMGAEVIVRERQNQTLERLLSSSVKREAILGGIFAGSAVRGLIQIAIFWTVGILAYNMDVGLSVAAVVILSILMVIMSSAFGIMLAAMVRTQRSAGALANLFALVLAPLGGCWWPLFITPDWMQFLAKFTPHGWATTGFNKLMVFGGEFGDVTFEMLALLGFTVLFLVIGIWRFRASAV